MAFACFRKLHDTGAANWQYSVESLFFCLQLVTPPRSISIRIVGSGELLSLGEHGMIDSLYSLKNRTFGKLINRCHPMGFMAKDLFESRLPKFCEALCHTRCNKGG